MYEKIDKCPLCGNQEFNNAIICQDYAVSMESFALVDCSSCGFRITSPRPSPEEITKYYDHKNYLPHNDGSSGLLANSYKIARTFNTKKRLNIINGIQNPSWLLDYGCGTGHFLEFCSKNNWKIRGIETNNKARVKAGQRLEGKIFPALDELDHKEFNVITLWHVLEHVHDLNKIIHSLKNHLSKNGNLVIAVPNYKSYDANVFKEYWAGYDVPRHLYHFNQDTFKILAKNHGLKLQSIIPQKLDSYYISLLSHKYRKKDAGKSFNMFDLYKSFVKGWLSNSWAKKNDKNYSSLVYVLSK